MKKMVFISSPYSGDVEKNTEKAKFYARIAAGCGHVPIAPHLYFPNFMDEENATERIQGIEMGVEIMCACDEFWLMGGNITRGMQYELERAKEMKLPVRLYDDNMNRIERKTMKLDDRLDEHYFELIKGIKFAK